MIEIFVSSATFFNSRPNISRQFEIFLNCYEGLATPEKLWADLTGLRNISYVAKNLLEAYSETQSTIYFLVFSGGIKWEKLLPFSVKKLYRRYSTGFYTQLWHSQYLQNIENDPKIFHLFSSRNNSSLVWRRWN